MMFLRSAVAVRRIGLTVAVAATTVCVTACSSASTPQASPATTTQDSGQAAARPSPVTHGTATVNPADPKPSKTTAADAPAAMIKVPNGVGRDYQSAQDLWRAAGLHVAPAHDATGAHRLPVIDANWVVLAQNLKAGSKVPTGSFITATVKKYSDG